MSADAASRVDNRRALVHPAYALPIAAALVGALGVLGAVARPSAALTEARQAQGLARRRAAEARTVRDGLAAFRAAGGDERLTELEARAAAAFPERPSAVHLHAALRVVAEAAALELEDLRLGETLWPVEPGEPDEPDDDGAAPVVAREAWLAGRGRLGALLDFVAELERCGHPCAVRRVALARARADEAEFDFELELVLFHSGDARPAERREERQP